MRFSSFKCELQKRQLKYEEPIQFNAGRALAVILFYVSNEEWKSEINLKCKS